MALVFDGVSKFTQDISTLTSITWSHTVTDNTNGILVIGVGIRNTGANTFGVQTVTYGGNSCTLIREDEFFNSASKSSALFYLVNPPTGTANIVVSFEGSIWRAIGYGTSYTGADTASPVGAHNGQAGATGNNPSTSITTSFDNSVIFDACFVRSPSVSSGTPGGGQVERCDQTNGSTFTLLLGSTKLQAIAGGTSMSWTNGSNDGWSHSVAEIKELSTGWSGGTINGVSSAGKVNTVDVANITEINTV